MKRYKCRRLKNYQWSDFEVLPGLWNSTSDLVNALFGYWPAKKVGHGKFGDEAFLHMRSANCVAVHICVVDSNE